MIIAILYVLLSVLIQRKFVNRQRIKQIQAEMNAKMAELRKLEKNVSTEVMMAKQKEITALASESMRHQLRATLVILPIFFLLVYVALPYLFAGQPINATFAGFTFNSYRTLFVAIAFICGILATIIISLYDRIKAPKPVQTTT